MNIIQPGNKKGIITLTIIFLSVILCLLIGGDVFIYNSIVDLNHNINVATGEINKTEVENAELKNKLYSLLDPKALESLAQSHGLEKDKGPRYFQLTSDKELWAFVSRP